MTHQNLFAYYIKKKFKHGDSNWATRTADPDGKKKEPPGPQNRGRPKKTSPTHGDSNWATRTADPDGKKTKTKKKHRPPWGSNPRPQG
jgi:hypothetical protein